MDIGDIIAPRARGLFINFLSSVIPAWGATVVALIIGQLIYRRKLNLLWVSIVGLAALYTMVVVGPNMPVELPEGGVAGLPTNSVWILILFAYAAIASLLPVWVLLQPRDYINGLQLFVGLGILYGAILFAAPTIVAPAFNAEVPEGTPSMLPLLFVTIACGAISGFHGLVSSGTSSKQLNKETDARFIGYFGAVGEGALALAAILATTPGIPRSASGVNSAALHHPGMGAHLQLGFLRNIKIATLIAVGTCVALAFGAGGTDGTGGMLLWPLFGTTNQLLAGLTLLVITVILVRNKRPMWYTLAPLCFLLVMTISALLIQLGNFYEAGDWFLFFMDIIILAAAIMVLLECVSVLRKTLRANREEAEQGEA